MIDNFWEPQALRFAQDDIICTGARAHSVHSL